MGKYIIKMKDGSEQHVMPAVHNTLKDALLTLSGTEALSPTRCASLRPLSVFV